MRFKQQQISRAIRFAVESLERRTMLSTVPVADGVPVLNSLPGASAQIYLDFDGNAATYWNGGSNGWQFNVPATPAYDLDGDASTFNDTEQANIRQIWSRVAEKLSPFNVNITTVNPGSFADKSALHLVIGGDGSWFPDGSSSAAQQNAFFDPTRPNLAYTFSSKFRGSPMSVAESASSAIGQTFGLNWQSSWRADGSLASTFSRGNSAIAPVMGFSGYAARGMWWTGKTYLNVIQDDMAIIAGSNNGFGYRTDDHGNTLNTATAITGSKSGVIERATDVDYFTFTTAGGTVGLNGAVAQYGATLNLKLQVFGASGNLIATADSSTLGESLSMNLAAGTYHVAVSGHGMVGCYDANNVYQGSGADVGQYTLTVTGGSTAPATSTLAAPSSAAASGVSGAVRITWVDQASNETGFTVQRSSNSGATWTTLGSVGANVVSYSDSGIVAGSTYLYRVNAYSGSTTSGFATSGSITPIPATPTGVTAAALSTSQIRISWADVAGETAYSIERSRDGVNWTAAGTTGAGVLSFTESSLVAGTRYSYRVTAVGVSGKSPVSAIVSATTSAASTTTTLPLAPSNITVGRTGKKTAIRWTDHATNETGYRLEYTLDGVTWKPLATLGSNSTSYTTTLKNASTFTYRVAAYNAAGQSPWLVS